MSYKVSENDIAVHGMSSIETRPTSIGIGPTGHKSATELKEKMDELPAFIAKQHNRLVDDLGIEEEEPGENTLAGKVDRAVSEADAAAKAAEAAAIAAAAASGASSAAAESAENAENSAKNSENEAKKAARSSDDSAAAAEAARSDASNAAEDAFSARDAAVLAAQSADILQTQVDGVWSALEKKVENLESYLSPSPFVQLNAQNGIVAIPSGALPWASVDLIGGMTRREMTPIGTFQPSSIEYGVEYALSPAQPTPARFAFTLKNIGSGYVDILITFSEGENAHYAEITLDPDGKDKEHIISIPNESISAVEKITIESDHPSDILVGVVFVYPPEEETKYRLVDSPVKEVKSFGATGVVLSNMVIPEEVRNLPDYGCGINHLGVYFRNYIEWGESAKKYHRTVGVLRLTGNEDWEESSHGSVAAGVKYYNSSVGINFFAEGKAVCLCSHFQCKGWTYSEVNNIFIGSGGGFLRLFVPESDFPNKAVLKTFLANEYAGGTPVTIVAELATPEEIDLSNILSDDNLIYVAHGGSLQFVTDGGVPEAKVTVMKKEGL